MSFYLNNISKKKIKKIDLVKWFCAWMINNNIWMVHIIHNGVSRYLTDKYLCNLCIELYDIFSYTYFVFWISINILLYFIDVFFNNKNDKNLLIQALLENYNY